MDPNQMDLWHESLDNHQTYLIKLTRFFMGWCLHVHIQRSKFWRANCRLDSDNIWIGAHVCFR